MDKDLRMDFMTDKERKMVDDYLTKIDQNRGYMQELYARWEKEQEAYSGDQALIDNRPNSRVNIINANIEGQVSALVEQNLAVVCRGEGPSDQQFSDWARVLLDWTFRQNHIKRKLRKHEFRRELFGSAWFKLYFDPDAVKGYGLVKICTPSLNSIHIDMKVSDEEDVQDGEYIGEVMLKSKTWAKEEYGDFLAAQINLGGSDRRTIFSKERTTDDDNAFWLIQLWTKTDGILRMIEFSEDGTLLFDSFKEFDEDKKKFKDTEDPKPFYRYNQYPYFFTNLYIEEGQLYGFGDGKLLRPLQDMINDLYDQIRRAARPNRIFFDESSEVDLEDLDEDDGPVPCLDPNTTIRVVEVGKVNPALWQLVKNIHEEVQRVTRFSELMMGQGGKAQTATESAIQQQQGSQATDHKKLMLQETLVDVAKYALDIMMEKYTEGKAFRIDEDKDEFMWVDARQLNKVPVLKPATEGYIKEYKKSNPEATSDMYQFMQLEDGSTKSVDLDIEINIGAGLPKNKAFLYQMLQALAGMQVEGRSVISWDEFRQFAKDFLGLPLEDDAQMMQQPMGQPMPMSQPMGPMQNANVQGLSPQGAPMTSALPPGGGMV